MKMSEVFELSHDEEGYIGVTFKDFRDSFSYLCQETAPSERSQFGPFQPNKDVDKFDGDTECVDCVAQVASHLLSSKSGLKNLRRVFWGYFLGVYTTESLSELVADIKRRRKEYWNLFDTYVKNTCISTMQSLDPQIFHPLAPLERNPWAITQRSKELMNEIWQDVERTYQERALFQKHSVRKALQNILYVWSMEHSYISYKQGMNELLAIVYIVCYRDQIKEPAIEAADGSVKHFERICSSSPEDIEADAYTIFNALMDMDLQLMFDVTVMNVSKDEKHSQFVSTNILDINKAKKNETHSEHYNPLIKRCNHIYHVLLKENDYPLYAHLRKIDIEPHLFLIRWIRLIFSREFNVNESLNLWDSIFADQYLGNLQRNDSDCSGPSRFRLQLIDFFAVAMLIFVRQNLLEGDINFCLQRLFKYPPVEDISHLMAKAIKIRTKYSRESHFDPITTMEKSNCKKPTAGLSGWSVNHTLDGTLKDKIETEKVKAEHICDEKLASDDTEFLGKIRNELIFVASKIYDIYGKAIKLNSEDVICDIQQVHSDVTKIISSIEFCGR